VATTVGGEERENSENAKGAMDTTENTLYEGGQYEIRDRSE